MHTTQIMPSPIIRITQEQVSYGQAQSTKQAQAKQHVESILADRVRPPNTPKHYEKLTGFATHPRADYDAGTILLAGPMYHKTRPAIVVAPLSESFLAVPVLTHGGNGLKDYHIKREYMSVCDQRPGGWYKVQNDMSVLLTDAGMQGLLILPESTVHFTDPFDILYMRKTLILGKLCEYSTQVLLERYRGAETRAPVLVRGGREGVAGWGRTSAGEHGVCQRLIQVRKQEMLMGQ